MDMRRCPIFPKDVAYLLECGPFVYRRGSTSIVVEARRNPLDWTTPPFFMRSPRCFRAAGPSRELRIFPC